MVQDPGRRVDGPGGHHPSFDCCGPLGNVRSWRHRLVIYRDDRCVWDGPITNVEWGVDSVEIFAEDVLSWLGECVVHQNLSYKNADLNSIAAELIADDPGHDVKILAPAGVTGSRAYSRNVGQTLDHLKEGYHQRFGLVHVDYATQRRTPKASYHWYRERIARARRTAP